MAIQYLYAENSKKWYAVDLDDGNTVLYTKYKFEDNPDRAWWERAIYYEYEFIIRDTKNGMHALMFSFWEPRGRVTGCMACAMSKVWCIFPFDANEDGVVWDEQDFVHKIFKLAEQRLPKPVRAAFGEEIQKKRGYDPFVTDAMKAKAIQI